MAQMPEPPYVTAATHLTAEDSERLQAIARVRGVTLRQLCDQALSDALAALSATSSADVALDRRRENESNRLYAMANEMKDKEQAKELRRYAAQVRTGAAPLPSAQGRKDIESPRSRRSRRRDRLARRSASSDEGTEK